MIRQTVGDFVAVYNQLKQSLSSASSMAGSAMSLRQLESTLSGLVGKTLTSDPNISKLTDIGIYTTKDGVLAVDSDKLEKALAADAGAVEALFNPRRDATHTEATDPGIAFTLDAIRDAAVGTDGVLTRVEESLDAKSEALAEQLEKIEEREETYRARLEKQFGGLDAKLAAFKATQSYLEQQIEIWNNQYKN
jgi:flagellar hook-associated protein 2